MNTIANSTQTTLTPTSTRRVLPALAIAATLVLVSVTGVVEAGVVDFSQPDLGLFDWSDLYSGGASSGFDGAGAFL